MLLKCRYDDGETRMLRQLFSSAWLALSLLTVAAGTCASASPIEVWEFKQQTENLGPVTLLLSADAAKFVANNGEFVIVARKPDWKVITFNKVENLAYETPINKWPSSGLKVFNGRSELLFGKRSTYYDPVLKVNLVQFDTPMQGRFYGSNDPAIFRAAEKKQLSSIRLKVFSNLPVNDEQKKFLHGVYTLPYASGIPIEQASLTTDGSVTYSYRSLAISKKKMDSATFNYPTGYKVTSDKISVLVTSKQKKRFEDFLDAFTDDAASEKAKAEKKPAK